MHGTFERPRKTIEKIYRDWGIGMFALPILIAIALVGMAMTHSSASKWISDAAQAEFVGANPLPDVDRAQPEPQQEIRTVKAN
jgi:hypothetical protein